MQWMSLKECGLCSISEIPFSIGAPPPQKKKKKSANGEKAVGRARKTGFFLGLYGIHVFSLIKLTHFFYLVYKIMNNGHYLFYFEM